MDGSLRNCNTCHDILRKMTYFCSLWRCSCFSCRQVEPQNTPHSHPIISSWNLKGEEHERMKWTIESQTQQERDQ